MDKGVVKRDKAARKIQLEYCFDRLSTKKISQAYNFLVPDKTWTTGISNDRLEKRGRGSANDDSRNLYKSLLRSPKRRTNHW
jgi:hypothetical protein